MATLEERVQRLEDNEEIRRLKIRYARAVDAGFDVDTLVSLFTPDGVWDGGEFGVHKGTAAIRTFFTGMPSQLTFCLHFMCGQTIDVAPSGTEATGHWYLWELGTFKGQAVWIAMTYNDTYRKVNGKWLFATTKLNIAFMTPYEKGWVKERMMV